MSKRLSVIVPVVAGVFLMMGPGTVYAELISMDLYTHGDGLLTRDTVSKLDWLDLDQSVGASYNEIEAGAGGYRALGFRHANEAEVLALMRSFGFPASGGHPDYFSGAAFTSTLSCTANCGADGDGNNGIADRVPISPSEKIVFSVFRYIDPIPPHAVLTQSTIDGDGSSPRIGHYLVRDIPEPRMMAMCFLGFALGLALARSASEM